MTGYEDDGEAAAARFVPRTRVAAVVDHSHAALRPRLPPRAGVADIWEAVAGMRGARGWVGDAALG